MHRNLILALGVPFVLLTGCGEKGGDGPVDQPKLPERYTLEQLKNPETCQPCHPNHYREWEGSMHAYASIDPVFLAMNKRGQRETKGELGNFCVNCHAPMAVRENLVSEGGLDIEKAPKWAQGVTCYFCHNAVGLQNPDQHFNGNIKLANDNVMRGAFDGVDPGVHGVAKSSFHSPRSPDSSVLCGSCHDVVTEDGKGVHIERTFAEYKKSVVSFFNEDAVYPNSCQECHMPRIGEPDYIADNRPLSLKLSLPKRDHHEHRWAAVDVPLTDFPDEDAFRLATECELHDSINITEVQVSELGRVQITLETLAGHSMPSGTAQDRRLWGEFIAYREDGTVMFESGTIADGEVEEELNENRPNRAQLKMFRDHLQAKDGSEVHMFWEAGKESKSKLLRAGEKPKDINHFTPLVYDMPGMRKPARFVFRMRMRPMGIDVLQSLVKSGDLDAKFLKKVPTFTLANTHIEWRADEDDDTVLPSGLRFVSPTPEVCYERLTKR